MVGMEKYMPQKNCTNVLKNIIKSQWASYIANLVFDIDKNFKL